MASIEKEIHQSRFRDPFQKVAISILYTANWLQNRHQEFLRPFGITPQQFNILRILRGQHPNRISGVEIKSRMLDRSSDISRLLERLLKKDLIVKLQCPKDKRAADVGITTAGLTLLQQIDLGFEAFERNAMSLTEGEALELVSLLDKGRGSA